MVLRDSLSQQQFPGTLYSKRSVREISDNAKNPTACRGLLTEGLKGLFFPEPAGKVFAQPGTHKNSSGSFCEHF